MQIGSPRTMLARTLIVVGGTVAFTDWSFAFQ
jgi:hypothetical protein